jgi:protein-disulfide isomerase
MTDTNKRAFASRTAILAGLGGLLIGGGAVALFAGGRSASSIGGSRAESERIVRETLLENPEILREASQRLQQREMGKAVEANRAAFETPFAGAWAGAADADVTLVEFFDYACGYCRKSNADIERLLKEDPKLKVVWREWPVLGPDSELAAQVSLAAAKAGRFKAYYDRLFSLGRPTAQTIAQAQREAGVPDAAVAAMRGSDAAKQELAKNYQLAEGVGATGTPTFVVGEQVLQGAVGYEALKDAIEEARAAG